MCTNLPKLKCQWPKCWRPDCLWPICVLQTLVSAVFWRKVNRKKMSDSSIWVPPRNRTVTQGQCEGAKKTDFSPSVISLEEGTHIFQMFSDDNRRHYTLAWGKWLKHFVFSHTHLVQSSSLIPIWTLLLFAQTMQSTSLCFRLSPSLSPLQYLFKTLKTNQMPEICYELKLRLNRLLFATVILIPEQKSAGTLLSSFC